MTTEMHLLGEAIQEVTLAAWPVIWADNKYDQDSREVLETLRDWAEEFENWWLEHDEDWIDDHDYVEEIWKYTDLKSKAYVRKLDDVIEGPDRANNLQEFTAFAVCRENYDHVFGYMMEKLRMTREQALDKIRKWADDFWFKYVDRDVFEDYKNGVSYYDLADEYLRDAVTKLKEEAKK